jgi:hypothetical protein
MRVEGGQIVATESPEHIGNVAAGKAFEQKSCFANPDRQARRSIVMSRTAAHARIA